MLDFTAIDFETANSYRGSPCAVGLIRFRNGEAVDERRWLIRPPEQVGYFDPFHVALHGIDAAAVQYAPRWEAALPAIIDFIGEDTVVAHNAGFDIGVIRYACAVDNTEWPEMRFLCTMVLARRALRLPSYRLPYVSETLGVALEEHHDPLADARAAGLVAVALARQSEAADLEDLASAHNTCLGHMASGIYKGSVAIGGGAGLTFPGVNPDADPDGYLYGRVVVFTGTLMSMTRQIAWEECARVGAQVAKRPTKKTNVLVVGDINPAVLRPGSNITGKARRAFELQDQGQDIEVMTEDDFLRCLDGGAVDKFVLTDGGGVKDLVIEPSDRLKPLRDRTPAQVKRPPKPPKPLRRKWVPTDQPCSVEGCSDHAMFRTRSKPAYCNVHIGSILWQSGLVALESFTHPQDYLLTRCIRCDNVAHYRFEYVQQKIAERENTCRACFWRDWSENMLRQQGVYADLSSVSYERAQETAESNGYKYLGPLTNPSRWSDPHRVECARCGKITAERLGDISFGCTCTPRDP